MKYLDNESGIVKDKNNKIELYMNVNCILRRKGIKEGVVNLGGNLYKIVKLMWEGDNKKEYWKII